MVEKSVGLKVKITEYVDDSQPGWVRCIFKDAYGVEWSFIDKVSIFTNEYLDEESIYPQNGIISYVIMDEKEVDKVKIDTSLPIFIEAETGEHEFYVFKNQLTDYNKWQA